MKWKKRLEKLKENDPISFGIFSIFSCHEFTCFALRNRFHYSSEKTKWKTLFRDYQLVAIFYSFSFSLVRLYAQYVLMVCALSYSIRFDSFQFKLNFFFLWSLFLHLLNLSKWAWDVKDIRRLCVPSSIKKSIAREKSKSHERKEKLREKIII